MHLILRSRIHKPGFLLESYCVLQTRFLLCENICEMLSQAWADVYGSKSLQAAEGTHTGLPGGGRTRCSSWQPCKLPCLAETGSGEPQAPLRDGGVSFAKCRMVLQSWELASLLYLKDAVIKFHGGAISGNGFFLFCGDELGPYKLSVALSPSCSNMRGESTTKPVFSLGDKLNIGTQK